MSFIRRIFSKVRAFIQVFVFLDSSNKATRHQKSEEDYETVLSNLADDIQKRQLKLSEIRLRERRSTLLVTLYTLAAWVAYVSLWYMNILPDLNRGQLATRPSVRRAIKAAPVVIGPIMCVLFPNRAGQRADSLRSILFTRRVVQIWYMRKGDAEGAFFIKRYL